MNEIYIRGNYINSLQLKENLLDKVEESKEAQISNIPSTITQTSNYFNNLIVSSTTGRGRARGRGPLSTNNS